MPFHKVLRTEIVDHRKTTMNYELRTQYFKENRGFSLIEFLVVISIFGIAASLITASYLNFERNQKVRSTALQLKNDLRLTQNRALSGDKGPGGACASTSTLGGWYLVATTGQTAYSIGGDCLTGVNETIFFETLGSAKTVKLPLDTKINKIFYCAGDLVQPIAVLFRPLKGGVSFHNGGASFPGFFQNDGVTLDNPMPGLPQNSWISIELSDNNSAPTRFYWVKIEISGEINESKTSPTGC